MSATNRVTQIKDAEGATMTLGETDYQGQTLTHDILFSEMVTTLDNLSSYTGTHSDVWVVSFPKSGQALFYFKKCCVLYSIAIYFHVLVFYVKFIVLIVHQSMMNH